MTDSSVDARAWAYYAYNPRRRGHVYAIDGKELFLVHNYLTFEEHEGDTVDRDQALRDILGVDAAFSYEELSQQDWVARRLLADTFRDGRVFLAGDASHLWVPYAGFGMNAGIADVLNLTWLLNAVLAGWGDPGILDAYEAERRPITEQVSRLVMAHQQKVASAAVPEWIEEDSTRGREARELIGREAYELNVQQFAAEGLNFGYTYGTSPIIAHDGCEPPAFSMARYEPSTVPGSRAPHFSLGDGRSLYDLLDRDFTLLTFDEDDLSADGATCLMQAAARVGVPLSHLPLAPGEAPAVYDRKFVIVRGDQHIVWRGDFVPSSEAGLFERLRGADPHPADASSERGLSEPAVGRRS